MRGTRRRRERRSSATTCFERRRHSGTTNESAARCTTRFGEQPGACWLRRGARRRAASPHPSCSKSCADLLMRLREIAPEVYARDVLPLTAPLWAGRRTFAVYAEQTLETARSGYGRRHYRTIGLFDGATLVASFKRYERSLRDGARQLPAIGFGAVYTPAEV